MNTDQKEIRLDESVAAQTDAPKIPLKQAKTKKREKRSFNGYYLIAAFVIPFLIMLGVYICLEKHPFGNNSVLTLDLQAQYVYYYEAIRRLLTEGGSWLYSWGRTLGGEFMGIVAYYMASPFNLILVLFPKSMIVDAIMFIQLAKVGAMGLTFAYYLRKTRKTSDMQTISFAVMYALCAYSVVQMINPMWIDAMVFLPLLVLGIESMIRERKFILYTVSLVSVFCTNYYMGYMCAIFTFFYFLYYYFLVCDEIPQNPGVRAAKNPLSRILHSRGFETLMRFGVFTVIALLISAFMLLCAWNSLQFGKTAFADNNFDPTLRFDFFDLFVKMLPGSYDSVRPTGLPMIYCGLLALIALPLFFMSPAITKKKKVLSACMIGLFVLSFSINTIDLVWHGFSGPNWLNYRYSYLFSFFILLLACDAIRTLEKIPFNKILTVGVTIGILVTIVQKLDYVFPQDSKTNALDDMYCILLTLVLLAVYISILYLIKQDKMGSAGAFGLAVVICVEMFATSLLHVTEVQTDVGSTRYGNYLSDSGKTEYYSGYTGSIKRIEPVVNEILERDKTFYRMESTVYRKTGGVNEPMAYGYNGISHSTSTLNADVIRMMAKLGYASQSHWTKYLGGTSVSDALLGIKYVVTKNDKLDTNIYTVAAEAPEYYEFIPNDNTIYAMQNTKALSVAYGVSPNVLTTTEGFLNPPYITALELQNTLINAMLSDVMPSPNVFHGIYASVESDGCSHSIYSHTHKYIDDNGEEQKAPNKYYCISDDKDNAGTFRFVMEAKNDGDIYMHLPGVKFSDMTSNCKIYVNGSFLCDYFTNETWTVTNIGTFSKGDQVEVELRFTGGKLYISRASTYLFYYIDYEALNHAFSELAYASMTVNDFGNDYLKGTIDLPKGQELIFTTIPYDEGWKVYIDGKQVEYTKVLDSLIAVPSTAGYHSIEFVYRPNCVVYGGLLSLIGMLAFLLIVLWCSCRPLRKLLKCDSGRRVHFVHHAGDYVGTWVQESVESEVCKPLPKKDDTPKAPEKTEEIPAQSQEVADISAENTVSEEKSELTDK